LLVDVEALFVTAVLHSRFNAVSALFRCSARLLLMLVEDLFSCMPVVLHSRFTAVSTLYQRLQDYWRAGGDFVSVMPC